MKIEPNTYGTLRLCLSSGDAEDYPGCSLTLAFAKYYITIPLPALIKPERRWIDCSRHDWSKPGPDGKNGYWDHIERQYGFSLNGSGSVGVNESSDFFILYLGRQSGDSSTEQNWCCFLPWLQWRFIRFSLYDLKGEHFWTLMEVDEQRLRKVGGHRFDAQHEAKERVPKTAFKFKDYDGEDIVVTTHLEEREWLRGSGWFSWLSFFYKPIVHRSLDLSFSKETGPRKGSWKGGTIGHGINTRANELHETAFRRYCVENNMTFISTA